MKTQAERPRVILANGLFDPGRRITLFALLTILALCLCGCSSFNRAWKQAGHTAVPTNSIGGQWQGYWLSTANGHTGKLRCLITKESDAPCQARFHATYLKVLHFGYTVPLKVTQSNGVWTFYGEADLGKMAGGVYHYEGTTTPTHFHSTYSSKYDHGDFEMTRPAEDGSPTNKTVK